MHGLIFRTSISLLAGSTRFLFPFPSNCLAVETLYRYHSTIHQTLSVPGRLCKNNLSFSHRSAIVSSPPTEIVLHVFCFDKKSPHGHNNHPPMAAHICTLWAASSAEPATIVVVVCCINVAKRALEHSASSCALVSPHIPSVDSPHCCTASNTHTHQHPVASSHFWRQPFPFRLNDVFRTPRHNHFPRISSLLPRQDCTHPLCRLCRKLQIANCTCLLLSASPTDSVSTVRHTFPPKPLFPWLICMFCHFFMLCIAE
jgi:hypothetical protein